MMIGEPTCTVSSEAIIDQLALMGERRERTARAVHSI